MLSLDYTNIQFNGLIVFIAGFFLGIKFPDWDFKLKLKHRSILTHSPLILLPVISTYYKNTSVELRYLILGLSLSIAIHLIFDIFPKGWGGGSLLKIPILRLSIKPRVSKVLFLIFIVISILVSIRFTNNVEELFFLLIYGNIYIIINVIKEKKLLRPISMFNVIILVFSSMKYSEINDLVGMVYTYTEKCLIKLL